MDQLPLFDQSSFSFGEKPERDLASVVAQYQASFNKPKTLHLSPSVIPSRSFSLQLELNFARTPVSFVSKRLHYALKFELTAFFQKRHRCGPQFTRVGFVLERRGICFVGDILALSGDDLQKITKNKRIVEGIQSSLHSLGLRLGMLTPGWHRPDDSRILALHLA